MPRDFPDDISKQSFITEVYDKERTAQLKAWRLTRSSRSQHQPAKSKQFEVFSRRLEAACPQPTPQLVSLRVRQQQQQQQEKASTKDDSLGDDTGTIAASQGRSSCSLSSQQQQQGVSLPPIESAAVIQKSASADMLRPDSVTRRNLYNGSSHEGRQRYLRARHRHRPQSRYLFPLVSSWDYGWKQDQVINIQQLRNPPHGRSRVIEDTFYTRNGLPQLAS